MPNHSVLPEDWHFRPMTEKDIEPILEIIWDHDSDDYHWASRSYEKAGIDNQYVLDYKGSAAGVTGFHPDDATDGTCWLSWTYLDSEYRGSGRGKAMMTSLFEILHNLQFRKIFVSTSDYEDEDEGNIYAAAIKFYEAMGFVKELVHEDYYQPGEAELIFGYRLRPAKEDAPILPETSGIVLTGLFEIQETRGAYALDWEFKGNRRFTADAMNRMIQRAGKIGARCLFIALPSNIYRLDDPLESCGLTVAGRLEDFYADGIHEFHFRYNFKR